MSGYATAALLIAAGIAFGLLGVVFAIVFLIHRRWKVPAHGA